MGRIFLVTTHPSLRDALTLTIQQQSEGALVVVGAAGWEPEELAVCAPLRPDVIVLAVGIETGSDLRVLEQIQHLAPHSRVLAVDTLGTEGAWPGGWGGADAVLRTEQLSTELVPTLQALVARGP